MAKATGVLCMFCGSDPCECNAKPAAKPRKKPAPPASIVTPDTIELGVPGQPPVTQKIREAAQRERYRRRIEIVELPEPTMPVGTLSEEDAALLGAIRNLAAVFELEGPGVDQFRAHLSAPASLAEQAAAWRYRRNRYLEDNGR